MNNILEEAKKSIFLLPIRLISIYTKLKALGEQNSETSPGIFA
jgi:hypothetical protein